MFFLAAAGVLPLSVMAGASLYSLARQQRSHARGVGIELARSVATAVDAELRSTTSILEALATTPTLDRHDLAGFRERAVRVLRLQPDWVAIVLVDSAGEVLLDTRLEQGGGPVADRASLQRVIRSRAPAIGNLTRDSDGRWLFSVSVPVVRAGEVRYLVGALVRPQQIHGVLTRLGVPHDWVISIVDARGLRVARSRAHDETLGGQLSDSVQTVVAGGGTEGFGVAYTLEGERIFTPYSRLAASGWMAVLGIPTAVVENAVNHSMAVYGGAVLLSLVLGTLAAVRIARTINRPMAELAAAAKALGRREGPLTTESSIREIRDVAAALGGAYEELATTEAQRDDLLRKERYAREAAEEAGRVKDEFMAVLSHELRTPLNAVYGWARTLQIATVRDEATIARALEAIVRNADVQVRLIDDLLDVSRIVSGKMRLEVRVVELEAVLRDALDAVRPAAEAKGIRVQTVLDPHAGPVSGDPARLQQVVWNLLMNAVKFTPKGGRVQLRLQRVNSHVEIVVADSGQGIAPDILPHVFERFRQADSSSTRAHGGLGLGLALVKHLVELHGGTVVAESAGERLGATFVVGLPLAIAAIPDESGRAHSTLLPQRTGSARLDSVRVLLVDDDMDAVRLGEAILTGAGAEVRSCRAAADAFEVLRQWRPDVLVSDIEMPGEDGYSLIQKVRNLAAEEGGDTPAIALTAYGRPQDRARSLAAGYNMHVPKPVDPRELTLIVASVAGQPFDAPRSDSGQS